MRVKITHDGNVSHFASVSEARSKVKLPTPFAKPQGEPPWHALSTSCGWHVPESSKGVLIAPVFFEEHPKLRQNQTRVPQYNRWDNE
jgi:hypothetical protein